MPLTSDIASAITFLSTATTSAITQQGTIIEDALRLAMLTFSEHPTGHPIVVLASDGENHDGQPILAAQQAAAQGITVYTLGYGGTEEGATIPYIDEDGILTYKADQSGAVVLTLLEEEMLQDIAVLTGGIYQRAGGSGAEIINLANLIKAVEADVLGTQRTPRNTERFGIFVALALLALSLEILLPETRGNII